MELTRGDIILVVLDPVVGSEAGKARPCIVVSPDEVNHRAPTLLVVPITTKRRLYPTRVNCHLDGRAGQAMTEQIRVISRQRILRKLEHNSVLTGRVLDRLQELFAL